MRIAMFAIGMLLAGEAALACVCTGPQTEAERLETARRIASEAAAVAEVEQIEAIDPGARQPELYRVRNLYVGSAPAQFRLAREFGPAGEIMMTSCDVVPPAGEPRVVVLYASDKAGQYRIGGTCDDLFITSPGAVDLVRQQAGAVEGGERG